MFAALDARNVVVYGGDESVVRFNIFLYPPYTTHETHTTLPGARRMLRSRMHDASRRASLGSFSRTCVDDRKAVHHVGG